MGKGNFKVQNLDFRRARLASFLGSTAKLGAAKRDTGRVDVTGYWQCIDANGISFLSVDVSGHMQSRKLSAKNVIFKSHVSRQMIKERVEWSCR